MPKLSHIIFVAGFIFVYVSRSLWLLCFITESAMTPYVSSASSQPSPPLSLSPPPVCSEDQLVIVKRLFQGPIATRCPHATWWDEHMLNLFLHEAAAMSHAGLPASLMSSSSGMRLGIVLGCNKGDDAVALLATLSGNRNISVGRFREAFANVSGGEFVPRVCQYHPLTALNKYHPLWKVTSKVSSSLSPAARVFCVEAGTNTANTLQKARDQMEVNWKDLFTVTHAAMSSKDGTAYFPKVGVGTEHRGMCPTNEGTNSSQPPPDECEPVMMYSLDSYIDNVVRPKLLEDMSASDEFLIDVLSVDVEGFDWVVLGLGGANQTLPRVKYLEFEYHEVGMWAKYNLSDVALELWEKYNFICYYAGIGELWRVTNCFQPYFNDHMWSNIVCVNILLNPVQAEIMESMFQRQLLQ